jgi:hypothetical protein
MAHYAFLDENNIVTEVIVGVDESETIDGLNPETWYGNFRNQICKRTSYNNKIRYNYAGIGYKYDELNDAFIPPKPYESWILDETFNWQPPIPLPDNIPFKWYWNEKNLKWQELEI